VLANLITLDLESIGTNCTAPTATLAAGPPQRALPVMIMPKQKFTAVFTVTFDCPNDPLKGPGHEDYRYVATVHHEAIDGIPDSVPADDVCPRSPAVAATSIYPTGGGAIVDKGCGAKTTGGPLGAPVTTDVTMK
jgi:hypothetical protein